MNRSPFIVYVLPVILSVSLGTFVMAEALNDSDRELNFLQSGDMSSDNSNKIDIIGLKTNYSASESIQFNVKITGKSLAKIASYPSRPKPGQAKICSKITEPPISPGSKNPNIVTKGSRAFRKACR